MRPVVAREWRTVAAMRGLPWSRFRRLGELVLVAATYYAVAEIGLQLALVNDSVTPLWPPTGLAVVAFLAFGPRVWPAVAIAAFAVNLPIGPSAWTALAIAVGNTAAPLAAALLLRRFGFALSLRRVRDAVALVVVALGSMTISATIGATTLAIADALDGTRYLDAWWVWWTGDAMGVLIVAPFLWSLTRLWPLRRPRVRPARVVEALVLAAVLTAATLVAAFSTHPYLFIVLPVTVWIAWRFQQEGAAVAALAVSVVVILAAAHDHGPFSSESLLEKMVVLQLFNSALTFTSFFFAAAVAERYRMLEDLVARERSVAETLQQSLLPTLVPSMRGVDTYGRYVPAHDEAKIGGDWYDVFAMPGDRVGFAVGDVAGHGIHATAAMAQLRLALRGYAIETASPAAAIERLNHLAHELYPELMATLIYGILDPVDRTVRLASAGHPPPLHVTAAGDAHYLDGALGAPVGALRDAEYHDVSHQLDQDDTLLVFTDGLVEQRSTPIDTRLEELRTLATPGRPLDETCDALIAAMLVDHVRDDVALLAVRPVSFARQPLRFHRANQAESVGDVRRVMRRWLVDAGATEDETMEILVAASEAHTNAVHHAYEGRNGMVEVEVGSVDGDVVITVRDRGHWRPPRLAPRDDGGRGLPLMNALMDAVEIHAGQRGTEVRLRRRLIGAATTPPSVDTDADADAPAAPDGDGEPDRVTRSG